MYPAILITGSSGLYGVVESVWAKYNKYMYFLTYDTRAANFPKNIIKDDNVVYWVNVQDSLAGKVTVVYKETKDFSFQNLDKITHNFLLNYQTGSTPGTNPTGKGDIKNENANQTDPGSRNKDEGKVVDATGTGKGGTGGGGAGFWEIPPWVWLIGAGFAGMKFVDTTDTIGKVLYGSAGAFCGYQYLNKKGFRIKKPEFLSYLGLGAIPDTQRLPKRINL